MTRLGVELRLARLTAGLTQCRVAEMVGVSQSFVSLVERGRRRPGLTTACALASAAGCDLSLKLFPTATVGLRDSGQFGAVELIGSRAHAAWHRHVEHPVGAADRRAADLLLVGATEVLHIEVERALVDFQAQLRAAQLKRAALSELLGRSVRLVIALPGTRRNRQALAAMQPGIGQALPKPSSAVWRAIETGAPLGGDGLLLLPPRRRHMTGES